MFQWYSDWMIIQIRQKVLGQAYTDAANVRQAELGAFMHFCQSAGFLRAAAGEWAKKANESRCGRFWLQVSQPKARIIMVQISKN